MPYQLKPWLLHLPDGFKKTGLIPYKGPSEKLNGKYFFSISVTSDTDFPRSEVLLCLCTVPHWFQSRRGCCCPPLNPFPLSPTSSTELLVVHLCEVEESASCTLLLDMDMLTGTRYPSNTQVTPRSSPGTPFPAPPCLWCAVLLKVFRVEALHPGSHTLRLDWFSLG